MAKSYHSSSGSAEEFDLEKENALNEEKLRDITLQKEISKDSLKSKIVKGINNKSKKKGRLKRTKEMQNDQVFKRNKIDKAEKPAKHGILKKSVSNESGKYDVREKESHDETKPIVGGTKALLVQKVCIKL